MHPTVHAAQPLDSRARPNADVITSREVLTFTLGQEAYGIDIQKFQELRGYDTVTRIPTFPISLRA